MENLLLSSGKRCLNLAQRRPFSISIVSKIVVCPSESVLSPPVTINFPFIRVIAGYLLPWFIRPKLYHCLVFKSKNSNDESAELASEAPPATTIPFLPLNLTFVQECCRLGCFRGSTCWYVLYFKSTMAASDSCPNPPIIMRDVLLIDTLQWS